MKTKKGPIKLLFLFFGLIVCSVSFAQPCTLNLDEQKISVTSKTDQGGQCIVAGTITFNIDINNGFKHGAVYLYSNTTPAISFPNSPGTDLPGCTAPQQGVLPLYAFGIDVTGNSTPYTVAVSSRCGFAVPTNATMTQVGTSTVQAFSFDFSFPVSGACNTLPAIQGFIFGGNSTGFSKYQCTSTLFEPGTTLPVRFSALQANKINERIKIQWQSQQEDGVKDYSIEASEDGKTWTSIGKIASKSPNGSSNEAINYEFSVDLGGIAFSVIAFAFLLIPVFGRFRAGRLVAIAAFLAVLAACAKGDAAPKTEETANIWIRVVQHDINGGSTVSKIIKVANQ